MSVRALLSLNIRRIRVARSISQELLAAEARIDRTYVSRLERGLENPTVAILERISKALGCEIVELFAARSAGQSNPGTLKPGRKALKPQKKNSRQRGKSDGKQA